MVGPFRAGRVNAVTGVVGQPNTFYFGSVGGGVWKTTNIGRTWTPIFDSQQRRLDRRDRGRAFEPRRRLRRHRRGRHARLDRVRRRHVQVHRRRQDAGSTSDSRRRGRSAGSSSIRAIPNIVFVAALGHVYGPHPDRGVYRSNDGGATWQKVLFKGDGVGAIDLAFDPVEPADGLRRAVGRPASAMVHLRAGERTRQRPLQVHRRRHDVERS